MFRRNARYSTRPPRFYNEEDMPFTVVRLYTNRPMWSRDLARDVLQYAGGLHARADYSPRYPRILILPGCRSRKKIAAVLHHEDFEHYFNKGPRIMTKDRKRVLLTIRLTEKRLGVEGIMLSAAD